MADHISVPIKLVRKEKWGDLTVFGHTHSFVGETPKIKGRITFQGNHRVQQVHIKKNVHWKIPLEADIMTVAPMRKPPRKKL